MKIFFVQFFCVFLPPLLNIFWFCQVHIISVLMEPIFAWNVPLVSLTFLRRSLVFPILLFSSISLHFFAQFSSVAQSCLTFCDPMDCTHQASLSITNSQSSPKPMSTESVMPSNHLITVAPFSSCPQSFPASGSFSMSQLFTSGGQSIGVSASASVLPMNIQAWFPLGWTGWVSLQSEGLSRVFSSIIVGKHQFFGAQPSF